MPLAELIECQVNLTQTTILAQWGRRYTWLRQNARSSIVDDPGSDFAEAQSNVIQQHSLQSNYNTLEYCANSTIYLLRTQTEKKIAAMIDF